MPGRGVSAARSATFRRRLRERSDGRAARHQSGRAAVAVQLELIDGWWRAANYLSVGQIYLLDNPLLEQPLERAHIKPRLLGHWGTTPGLNFIYVHLNRVIKARDLDVIYICGPGHGGPGMVANTWLEGTYSELYSSVPQTKDGMRRLFRQFSFPGGIPSHAAPETPGSIHEGGELGYSLSHAYGAVLDNPDLIAACVIGDGEAETGPLATSWHGNKFLNPATDGAVLPILHLNGYKIANPTILARIPHGAARSAVARLWLQTAFCRGRRPAADASADGGGARPGGRRDRGTAEGGARRREDHLPAMADDRAAQPQGLDRAQDRRRVEDRGLLARPPGPVRRHGKARARQIARRLDEELSAARIVRRRGPAEARDRGIGAAGRPADERQPERQWRIAAPRAGVAGFHRLCGGDRGTRAERRRGDANHGRLSARHHQAERKFPPVRAGRNRFQPPLGGVRGDRTASGWPRPCPRTTI